MDWVRSPGQFGNDYPPANGCSTKHSIAAEGSVWEFSLKYASNSRWVAF